VVAPIFPLFTVWANNADAISEQYAGTGALKTDYTRTGKRSVQGVLNDGLNSAMRYYINNFQDGFRQVRSHVLNVLRVMAIATDHQTMSRMPMICSWATMLLETAYAHHLLRTTVP